MHIRFIAGSSPYMYKSQVRTRQISLFQLHGIDLGYKPVYKGGFNRNWIVVAKKTWRGEVVHRFLLNRKPCSVPLTPRNYPGQMILHFPCNNIDVKFFKLVREVPGKQYGFWRDLIMRGKDHVKSDPISANDLEEWRKHVIEELELATIANELSTNLEV